MNCPKCGKEVLKYHNYCSDMKCVREMVLEGGGKEYLPNGLEIGCIRHDGLMLECEHGDLVDYKFPVLIEYIGEIDQDDYNDFNIVNRGEFEATEENVRLNMVERHALLFTNYSIAVTMYETCSAAWALSSKTTAGICLGGDLWKPNDWKISTESLEKISKYLEENNQKQEEWEKEIWK